MTQHHAATALLQAALRRRLLSVKEALALRHVLKGCGNDPHLVAARLADLPGSISAATATALLALLPAIGTRQPEPYRRLAELGRGRLGTTWLGLGADRLVVLKDLDSTLIDEAASSVVRAELAPLLGSEHRYLIPYLDLVASGAGGWTLVQEYRPGRDAWQRAELKGEASETRALTILRHAAKGLWHLHQLGLCHAHLHPGNLLLNSDGRVALGDHALAGRAGTPRLNAVQLGRQAWAAPEELGDQPSIGAAADLYALGCIGYWLLAGEPPFPGTPDRQALQHVFADRPDVRLLAPGVSELTAKTILKCMQVDPAQRYADARSLILSLERDLDLLERPQPDTEPTAKSEATRPVSPLLLDGLAGLEEEPT